MQKPKPDSGIVVLSAGFVSEDAPPPRGFGPPVEIQNLEDLRRVAGQSLSALRYFHGRQSCQRTTPRPRTPRPRVRRRIARQRSGDASRDGPGEPESDLDPDEEQPPARVGGKPRHISAVLRDWIGSVDVTDGEPPHHTVIRLFAILRAGPIRYFRDWLVARRIGREVFGR